MVSTIDPIRYPIGTFQAPAQFRTEDVQQWIADVRRLPDAVRAAVADLNDEQLNTPYRDGGWTVAQVVHHLADASMNAFLRTKWGLTEEAPTVKPFIESEWAKTADARTLSIESSLLLLDGLHARWAMLLESMTEANFHRLVHPEGALQPMPLYVLTALYTWHGKHHTAQITSLRERKGW
ncbi:hydrolase [Geobacillus genomosp. 3]|uniref:Putative metal-dependent hydrolase M493_03205 n=1 Tax=Geobacillus genomosp. 3 TaxID=1921421 RepID=S5YW75_GEOG3|nr:hydrolase [Geobacillus genomosp. 3]